MFHIIPVVCVSSPRLCCVVLCCVSFVCDVLRIHREVGNGHISKIQNSD